MFWWKKSTCVNKLHCYFYALAKKITICSAWNNLNIAEGVRDSVDVKFMCQEHNFNYAVSIYFRVVSGDDAGDLYSGEDMLFWVCESAMDPDTGACGDINMVRIQLIYKLTLQT